MASGDFDCNISSLETIFERGSSVGCVKAAIFTVDIEVGKVIDTKVRGVEDAIDQAVYLTFRLGLAPSVHPIH